MFRINLLLMIYPGSFKNIILKPLSILVADGSESDLRFVNSSHCTVRAASILSTWVKMKISFKFSSPFLAEIPRTENIWAGAQGCS